MALITFAEVVLPPIPADRVRGFSLDGPRRGGKVDDVSVEFNGWIVADPIAVESVDLLQDEVLLLRMRADRYRRDVAAAHEDVLNSERSGFKERFNLSEVEDGAELRLVARFEDGTELLLATMITRRGPSGLAVVARAAPGPTGFHAAVDIANLDDHGDGVSLPRVSIIIPVHGRSEFTRQCLNTLLADRSPAPRFEVIVVDDASPDDTGSVLAEYGTKMRVISLPQNVGFAGACNAGAVAARGDYLVFLNNDTVPEPGWLGGLAGYANVTPAASVVGAKLLFPDHTIQHAGVVIGLDRYSHHIYAGFPADHPAVNKPRRFPAVTAACCLIRRGAFQTVGGFDRAFVNGWEDVDLCLRLGERGHEIHYAPASVVYHFESSSRDPRSPTERHNRELYARRWLGRVQPDLLAYLIEDGLLTVSNETPLYPLLIDFSPLLAVVRGNDDGKEGRLLEQARQIALLQSAVADLQERLLAAERVASLAATATA